MIYSFGLQGLSSPKMWKLVVVSSTDMYADDTTIYDIQTDMGTLRSNLQESLTILQKWCKQNGMLLNTEKTKVVLISTRQKIIRLDTRLLSLTYNETDLQLTTGDKNTGCSY